MIPQHLRHLLVPTLSAFLGYGAFYFTKINFAIASPKMISTGFITSQDYGRISAAGYLAGTLGKIFMGYLSDQVEVKIVFMASLATTIFSTMMFTVATSTAQLELLWSLNRWMQSAGWIAIVKIVGNLWPTEYVGTIIGLGALFYCVSETITRWVLSELLTIMNWEQIYALSALIAAVLILPTWFYVPKTQSFPSSSSLSSLSDKDQNFNTPPSSPSKEGSLFKTLLSSPRFPLILVLSLSLTIFRETYASWTPLYLHQVFSVPESTAGKFSMIYPLCGGLSALFGGFMMDKFRSKLVPLLFILLIWITQWEIYKSTVVAVTSPSEMGVTAMAYLIGMNAFGTFAPFTFLDGVFLADFVPPHLTATTVGIINSVGYVGSGFVSYVIGEMDWSHVMHWLVWNAAMAFVAAFIMMVIERRQFSLGYAGIGGNEYSRVN